MAKRQHVWESTLCMHVGGRGHAVWLSLWGNCGGAIESVAQICRGETHEGPRESRWRSKLDSTLLYTLTSYLERIPSNFHNCLVCYVHDEYRPCVSVLFLQPYIQSFQSSNPGPAARPCAPKCTGVRRGKNRQSLSSRNFAPREESK